MFALNRWNPFEEMFTVQREADRLLNRFWSDLPARTQWSPSFQVQASEDHWRIEIPLPGVDPSHIALDAAGRTLTVRVQEPGDTKGERATRFEQTLTLPPFLDVDRLTATCRHGMLYLTVPLVESVKPRRIQIDTSDEPQKQLAA